MAVQAGSTTIDPVTDDQAVELLATGTPATEVAQLAGCPDVATLEEHLFPTSEGDFAIIDAPFQVAEVRAQNSIMTPLSAEQTGLSGNGMFRFTSFFSSPQTGSQFGSSSGFRVRVGGIPDSRVDGFGPRFRMIDMFEARRRTSR